MQSSKRDICHCPADALPCAGLILSRGSAAGATAEHAGVHQRPLQPQAAPALPASPSTSTFVGFPIRATLDPVSKESRLGGVVDRLMRGARGEIRPDVPDLVTQPRPAAQRAVSGFITSLPALCVSETSPSTANLDSPKGMDAGRCAGVSCAQCGRGRGTEAAAALWPQ